MKFVHCIIFLLLVPISKCKPGGSPQLKGINPINLPRMRSTSAPPQQIEARDYKWIDPKWKDSTWKVDPRKTIVYRMNFEHHFHLLKAQVPDAVTDFKRFIQEWSEVGPAYEINAFVETIKYLVTPADGTIDEKKINLIVSQLSQPFQKLQPWYQRRPELFAGITAAIASLVTATVVLLALKKNVNFLRRTRS